MYICLINHDCCEVLSETHKESYVFLVIYKPTKVKKKQERCPCCSLKLATTCC